MESYKTSKGDVFDREFFEKFLKHRLFYTESFEIYRGASNFKGDNRGLYDYGPPGCALEDNIIDSWRKHFVLEEGMLEIRLTILTHEDVFKTSGHVAKFSDWMGTGDPIRADHLVRSVLESRLGGPRTALTDSKISYYRDVLATLDNFDGPELGQLIESNDIRSPDTGNEVLPPIPFNLMFQTSIGPTSRSPAYLRPETAQGHFVNFKKLLKYNQNHMPFASASVGKSFRNEISPRQGLLRVGEFTVAEIEHFLDPQDKKHPRLLEIADLDMKFLRRETQEQGGMNAVSLSIGEAVATKSVDNETLGFFWRGFSCFSRNLEPIRPRSAFDSICVTKWLICSRLLGCRTFHEPRMGRMRWLR